MSEHTRTPWRVYGDEAVVGADDVWVKPYETDSWEGDRKWPDADEAQANACHIVHCVNNHDRLVEALREVTASLAWNAHGECRRLTEGPIMPSSQAVEVARALLAQLQAGKGG